MVKFDLDHQMITHYCSVEWLTTYSNLDECVPKLHSDDRNAASFFETFYYCLSQSQGSQSLSFQPQEVLLEQIFTCLCSHQLFQFQLHYFQHHYHQQVKQNQSYQKRQHQEKRIHTPNRFCQKQLSKCLGGIWICCFHNS